MRHCFFAAAALSCFVVTLTASPVEKKLQITTASGKALSHYLEARQALEAANFSAIAGHLQAALREDPNFAFALMLQSAPQNITNEALATLQKALEKARQATEGERRYRDIEATITYRNGDIPGAIDLLEVLVKDYPEDRGIWMFLGQLYEANKQFDKAENAYLTAKSLDGSSYRVYQLLSQLYQAQNQIDKAQRILQKASDIEVAAIQAYTDLGTLELLRDNYATARESYSRAGELADPDATPLLPFFGQAWAYVYEGKPDPAIGIIQEYLDRYNRNGTAQGFPPVWIWKHMGRI